MGKRKSQAKRGLKPTVAAVEADSIDEQELLEPSISEQEEIGSTATQEIETIEADVKVSTTKNKVKIGISALFDTLSGSIYINKMAFDQFAGKRLVIDVPESYSDTYSD